MEIRFFPIEFVHKIRKDKPFIYMYGKLEDNTKICVIQEYQPYFYAQVDEIHKQQLEKRLKALEIETNNGVVNKKLILQ